MFQKSDRKGGQDRLHSSWETRGGVLAHARTTDTSVLTLKFAEQIRPVCSFLSSVPEGQNVYKKHGLQILEAPKELNVPKMISLLRSFILVWTLRFYKH